MALIANFFKRWKLFLYSVIALCCTHFQALANFPAYGDCPRSFNHSVITYKSQDHLRSRQSSIYDAVKAPIDSQCCQGFLLWKLEGLAREIKPVKYSNCLKGQWGTEINIPPGWTLRISFKTTLYIWRVKNSAQCNSIPTPSVWRNRETRYMLVHFRIENAPFHVVLNWKDDWKRQRRRNT